MNELKPNPYLHIERDRIDNPLTGRALVAGEPMYQAMQEFLATGKAAQELERDGWIVSPGEDLSRSYHLKFVSLETATSCNQKCYFCPVSIAPRADSVMSEALFRSIVTQLTSFRDSLEGVFLQSYNEPTVDRAFVEQCGILFDLHLPVAVLSNGTGLTRAKVDALMARGRLRYLAINLSTLDRERYAHDRGGDHLDIVLRNLDSMKDRDIAQEMNIVVLGVGDDVHQRDFDAISERFANTRFGVRHHVVMDRAGRLDVGLTAHNDELRGCDNLGSRPIQHLHITPRGQCVLCCEDYDENYVVGDASRDSIAEILRGDRIAEMRRWTYGVETAPPEFICRKCVFARRGPAQP